MKRNNSRDVYEVKYDLSELPSGYSVVTKLIVAVCNIITTTMAMVTKTLTKVMETMETEMDLVELKGVRS